MPSLKAMPSPRWAVASGLSVSACSLAGSCTCRDGTVIQMSVIVDNIRPEHAGLCGVVSFVCNCTCNRSDGLGSNCQQVQGRVRRLLSLTCRGAMCHDMRRLLRAARTGSVCGPPPAMRLNSLMSAAISACENTAAQQQVLQQLAGNGCTLAWTPSYTTVLPCHQWMQNGP
jgi:hypothetical protein